MTPAAAPPAAASVVVIGGGVMGCSTLYHLAAREKIGDAILLERHKITSGTTWHSAAQVRALRSSKNLTDLIRYSISLYDRLRQDTGQDTGWTNSGSISIACNPDRLAHIRRQAALARLFGLHAEEISGAEAAQRWQLMNADDVVGAVWAADDGRVNPSDLCAALIKGARAAGARLFEHTAVTAILSRNGKIVGVETTAGTIRCDAVALCAGLWSRDIANRAGVAAPLLPCEHFYLLTKPVGGVTAHMPTLSDHDSHLYLRDEGGGLLVGCFEPQGKVIMPSQLGDNFAFQLLPEDWEHFEPMMQNALHRVPALAHAEVKMLLNGPESFTPDGAFILGETAETAGLFLGCGMNSIGVAAGGGCGYALAQRIARGRLPMALPEADPKRFPDCFNNAATLAARAPEVLGKHYEITYPGRQPATARDLRETPLTPFWREARAHFGQFYGWERPLYFNKQQEPTPTFNRPDWFEQVGAEVMTAHNNAAVFDLSTFGKIAVRGADAESFLNRVCSNHMDIAPGRAVFTLMLNADGGMESDLVALRLGDDDYRLYTATAAVKRDLAWLRRHRRDGERVHLSDDSDQFAVIGLYGAQAKNVAAAVGADDINRLPYYRHGQTEIARRPALAVRLSYIGENGWEITCAAPDAAAIYTALRDAGATPAGVFAQTAMRVEKRFLAYGHDMDADMPPADAGLGFAVAANKSFIGSDAPALKNPPRSAVVSIVLDDNTAVPLGGEPVSVGDTVVGMTTSAAYGYRLQKPVALARVEPAAIAQDARRAAVNIAQTLYHGDMIRGAAYDPAGARMKPTV